MRASEEAKRIFDLFMPLFFIGHPEELTAKAKEAAVICVSEMTKRALDTKEVAFFNMIKSEINKL